MNTTANKYKDAARYSSHRRFRPISSSVIFAWCVCFDAVAAWKDSRHVSACWCAPGLHDAVDDLVAVLAHLDQRGEGGEFCVAERLEVEELGHGGEL